MTAASTTASPQSHPGDTRMSEPVRPLAPLIPLAHGGWKAESLLTSTEFRIRGLALVPPNVIVPVIVIPGIMGSNLRAKLHPRTGRDENERNEVLAPGQAAWRPPNGKRAGLWESFAWDGRDPATRQRVFDVPTLEVDDGGPIVLPGSDDLYVLTDADVRRRGWGEVHADSYGALLHALQTRLNQTFGFDQQREIRSIRKHWKDVMDCAPGRWGRLEFDPLTLAHLERHAKHYFPVYAVGYNWLESCAVSAQRLENRIAAIVAEWQALKRRCDKVILVTHSMGGLVARACAKSIPDRIAGIIHGAMPALGAPAAYRRMACGTEVSSPGNGILANLATSVAATILGDSTEKITPVLATSPGALELLPNHLYPEPWLHVRVMQAFGPAFAPSYEMSGDEIRMRETAYDYLYLPGARQPNPYVLYKDFASWYRLVNLALVDPAHKYGAEPDTAKKKVRTAIDAAERFHRSLGDYYHPNTYAFYGDDNRQRSFGRVRWIARLQSGSGATLTPANVTAADFLGHSPLGARRVLVEGKTELTFQVEPQDARGDGTVPHQSGAGPAGKIRQLFATQGYDHQAAFNSEDMLLLTQRLVVHIVQELP